MYFCFDGLFFVPVSSSLLACIGFREEVCPRAVLKSAPMAIEIIQALRAIAALLVVAVHLGNPDGFEARYLHATHPINSALSTIGYFGVDLFFLISGFIMVVTSLRSDGTTSSAKQFLERRLVRIYPPLWIINSLVLVVYIFEPKLVNSHGGERPNILASYLLLPQQGRPLVLVAWTLVFEMYFYLVFALGLMAGSARGLLGTLVLWAVAVGVLSSRTGSTNIYLAFVSNPLSFEFLIGAFIGFLGRKTLPIWVGVTTLGAGLSIFNFLALRIALGLASFPGGWPRVAMAIPLAAILLGLVIIERKRGTYTPPFLVRIGNASYAMYLWHIPILALFGVFVSKLFRGQPVSPVVHVTIVALAYLLVIATGIAVFRFIEKPVITTLRRRLMW